MTIGLGVLCSTYPGNADLAGKAKPDALIMMSDTMGSTEVDSMNGLHKLHSDRRLGVYSVSAGSIDTASEVFGSVCAHIEKLSDRRHGQIWNTINEVYHGIRHERFRWEVATPKFGALFGQLTPPVSVQDQFAREWQQYDLGIQMLIGTFDTDGMALLYYIGSYEGRPGYVHLAEFPGWFAIGAGCNNAVTWLNYREQHLGKNILQSAVHAYEATRMAAQAPSVNELLDGIVATKDKVCHFSDPETDINERCGELFSVKDLKALAKKYGPRSTSPLGFKTARK